MALGGLAEIFLGVKAENTPLEDIAKPLTAEEAEQGDLPGDESGDAANEERWQSRLDRQRRRRYRPGPGGGESYYSPGMIGTAGATRSAAPSVRDSEIDAIAAALDEHGPMDVSDLGRAVGARRWGPGRFRAALTEAVDEQRAVRLSRGRVGPA